MQLHIIKQMNKLKSILYVGMGQCFTLLTTLICTKIIIYYLTKDESSGYFITQSYITVLIALFISPLSQRYIQVKAQKSENDYLTIETLIKLINILFAPLIIILCAFNFFYTSALLLILCCELNKAILLSRFNIIGRRDLYALHSFIILFTRVGLTYFIISLLEIHDISVIFFTWSISIIVSLLIANKNKPLTFKLNLSVNLTKKSITTLISYSIPLSISAALSLCREQLPRYIFLFNTETAYISDYSALVLAATLLPLSLQLLVTTIVNPIISREYINNRKMADLKLILISSGVFIIVSMIALFMSYYSGNYISLVLSPKYEFLSSYLSPLIVSYAFYISGNILTIRLFSLSKTNKLLIINIITSLTSLILYIPLFEIYSFTGIVSALAASNIIFFTLSIWFFYEEKFKENKITRNIK